MTTDSCASGIQLQSFHRCRSPACPGRSSDPASPTAQDHSAQIRSSTLNPRRRGCHPSCARDCRLRRRPISKRPAGRTDRGCKRLPAWTPAARRPFFDRWPASLRPYRACARRTNHISDSRFPRRHRCARPVLHDRNCLHSRHRCWAPAMNRYPASVPSGAHNPRALSCPEIFCW